MRKLFLLFTIILGVIILFISSPKFIYYEPEVFGKVLDENNSPINRAKVIRVEEKVISHPRYGYDSVVYCKSDIVYTNHRGEFYFKKKGKIFFTWLKAYSKKCKLNLEIEKFGFKNYKSNENEWFIKNKSSLCNKTIFRLIIYLKKQ